MVIAQLELSSDALYGETVLVTGAAEAEEPSAGISADKRENSEECLRQALALCEAVRITLTEQSEGWRRFEHWKKTCGMSIAGPSESTCKGELAMAAKND